MQSRKNGALRSFAEAIVEQGVARPILVTVLLVILFLAAISQLPRYSVDNSLAVWFDQNAPEYEVYQAFQRQFGNDEALLISYSDPKGLLTQDHIRFMRRIEADLEQLPDIRRVTSFATLPRMDLMLSDDRTATIIVAEPSSFDRMDTERSRIIDSVSNRLEELFDGTGLAYRLAGVGVVYEALNRATFEDSRVLLAISYGVMIVLLSLLIRDWRLTLISCVALFYCVTIALGIYLAAGRQITMLSVVLPSVITVYAAADILHIVHAFRRTSGITPIRRDHIRHAMRSVALPCLLTSITTTTGFLALAVSPTPVIRDLGVFCAAGTIATYVATQLIMAVGLRFVRIRQGTIGVGPRMARWLEYASTRRPRSVLFIAIVIIGLMLTSGVFRLVVDTFSLELLSTDHPVRLDSREIESTFGPYVPIEFLVSGDTQDAVATTDALVNRLDAHPRIEDPTSVLDFAPGLTSLRSDEDIAVRLRSLPDEIERLYVDAGRSMFRVSARTYMDSARGFEQIIEDVIGEEDRARVVPAGYLPLYVEIMRQIPRTQIQSSLIAFAAVFIIIGVISRSARLTFAAIVANLLPIGAVLGLMGWAGIRLDLATVTITAIAIGIIVDDTIHVIYGIRNAEGADSRREQASIAVMNAGAPMMMTTLVLGVGFATLAASSVVSVARFGLLTACVFVAAFLCDVCVLPTLYAGTRGKEEPIE